MAPPIPYYVGQLMTVRGEKGSSIHLRVQKLQQPWTLSCGMVVEILAASPPLETPDTLAFLKLYDRRFAPQLREDYSVAEWCEERERSYMDFIEQGGADAFMRAFTEEDAEDDPVSDQPTSWRYGDNETWSVGQNETFLFDHCSQMFHAETTAYHALRAYQGSLIPRLISPVTLDFARVSEAAKTSKEADYTDTRGILIEYIPGTTLSEMEHDFPQAAWQGIVNQALAIVHIVGDNFVLNEDVRPDNFLIVADKSTASEPRVVMVDFGQSRVRRQDETDQEWGRAKWSQDEEGAVGLVMRNRLRKKGFELRHKKSLRYQEWAPGEDD